MARLDEALQNAERPIAMHCGSGNRVSGLWAVWLVEHGNMRPDEALRLAGQVGMKDVRPVVESRLGIEDSGE